MDSRALRVKHDDFRAARGETVNGRCQHIDAIETRREPAEYACEWCVPIGARWVHLRTCQTCGVTLCCDSSPHKHASAHARMAAHPVAASAEPGEGWLWCYVDGVLASD